MKNVSVILNIILLVAVGILYFLFFKNNHSTKTGEYITDSAITSGISYPMKIAYFNMDSVEVHYVYIKEVREQLKNKEQSMSNEMNGLKKAYMERIRQLQAKSQTMSQQEGEAAQAEINQMQQKLQTREGELTQSLQGEQFKMMQDINKKIEDYLKTYNQQKKYTFIFSHQPGDFIYYKDSLCNITSDIITGLNASVKK